MDIAIFNIFEILFYIEFPSLFLLLIAILSLSLYCHLLQDYCRVIIIVQLIGNRFFLSFFMTIYTKAIKSNLRLKSRENSESNSCYHRTRLYISFITTAKP